MSTTGGYYAGYDANSPVTSYGHSVNYSTQYYPNTTTSGSGGGVPTNAGSYYVAAALPTPIVAGVPENLQAATGTCADFSNLSSPNATDASGLRWTWTTFPNTVRSKAKERAPVASIPLPEMIVPMSCMYTPLQPLGLEHLVLDNPAQGQCPTCGAFLNRHGTSAGEKHWICLSCQRRNALPPGYTEQHPARVYDTVEYIFSAPSAVQDLSLGYPAFIFVVDVCVSYEELRALQGHLLQCLEGLPSHSLVGLISFGSRTAVWELGSATAPAAMAKSYILRGETVYAEGEMPQLLQVTPHRPVRGRFLLPLMDSRAALHTLIGQLHAGAEPLRADRRPLRTTGTAVAAATFLLESLRLNSANWTGLRDAAAAAGGVAAPAGAATPGKVLLFTGGPCTRGGGKIVGPDKAEMMRFHRDIIEENTPHYASAYAYYAALAERLAAADACLDVFAMSFDQTGVMEMRDCVNRTGGTLICGDSFDHDHFGLSLRRYFERCDLLRSAQGATGGADHYTARCAFGVHMEVHTSSNTLVSGMLGPCSVDTAANKKQKVHRAASPVVIGVGATTCWRASTLDQGVTFAVLFDSATLLPAEKDNITTLSPSRERRFIQFVLRYTTADGQQRVRVTSVLQPVSPPQSPPSYYTNIQAFDQTAATTVVARMAVAILEKYPGKWDATKRWLDTLLVHFVRRYGTYTPNTPESLRLEPCMALFPSFVFSLRRSEYLMVINISPDETTFKRHWLMRESVDHCILMIQPTLDSYDIENPTASAVPLDSDSLRSDNIVLMDAFFNVHIMWGAAIYEWILAKYHENPDYAYFAQLLEHPEMDAQAILAQRYPYPRFSRTDANGSEARHIKTRVNPSTAYAQFNSAAAQTHMFTSQNTWADKDNSTLIYSDEASIVKFMSSLKQAVVSTDTPK